jgi:Mrp family chromosome partitioning ATPase/predicted Fe-Mo cluster-binding NifX family protein
MMRARATEVETAIATAVSAMAAVPHKILVMSGKGGVGKTTVAVNLAFTLAARGRSVGIMDADLHGPNVALMTGIEGLPATGTDELLAPIVAARRVKVLSIASFLPGPDSPVVWRGPRKAGAIRQFLSQGDWRGVDVLVVDCPPGTGDEPMAVAELIPSADGVVIVTSPQDVALLDSRKCVAFVRTVEQRVLGIVENMSGFSCPACGASLALFKTGGGERAAEELGVPFLGRIPITPAMVQAGDAGRPLVTSDPQDPAAIALAAITDTLTRAWKSDDRATATGTATGAQGASEMRELRVVVAAEDDRGLDSTVSQHFGRCPYYLLAEISRGRVTSFEVQPNPLCEDHQPGGAPRYIRQLGADAILAGGMGPRAVQMFEQFGIDVATGASGPIGQVLGAYLGGKLTGTVPCAHDHPDSCGAHGSDCGGGH